MIRQGVRAALLLAALGTWAGSAWTLSQSPFAAPLVAKSTEAAEQALARAVHRRVDADWLTTELEAALAARDADRASLLLALAADHDAALPASLRIEAEDLQAANKGVVACARCAWDPAACADIPQLLACSVPVELTPVGDLNALRRESAVWLDGGTVDRVDVALASIGLGASAAVLITAGSSAAIKAGAGGLRVARRARLLTPRFSDEIGDLTQKAVRIDRLGDVVRGRAPVQAMLVAAPTARLQGIAADLSRLRQNTSSRDALALLGRVETSDDLTALVRISDAAGPSTRGTVEALGLARATRLASRLSDLALWTIAFLSAVAGQVLAGLIWLIRRWLSASAGQTPAPSP